MANHLAHHRKLIVATRDEPALSGLSNAAGSSGTAVGHSLTAASIVILLMLSLTVVTILMPTLPGFAIHVPPELHGRDEHRTANPVCRVEPEAAGGSPGCFGFDPRAIRTNSASA